MYDNTIKIDNTLFGLLKFLKIVLSRSRDKYKKETAKIMKLNLVNKLKAKSNNVMIVRVNKDHIYQSLP